jgi:protein-S-isoprenylcysteine O-methyltransferase Ste14
MRLLLKMLALAVLWTGIFLAFGYVITPPGARLASIRSQNHTILLLIFIACGAAVAVWSSVGFALRGLGTPAPFDPPRRLVVWGPYRWVRNPIYVGGFVIILGQLMLFRHWSLRLFATTAAFVVLFHFGVVLLEEPQLRRRFGPEYDDFCRHVPRWIPRFRPWSQEKTQSVASGG